MHEHDVTEPAVRLVPPADLVVDELCTPEDLLPSKDWATGKLYKL